MKLKSTIAKFTQSFKKHPADNSPVTSHPINRRTTAMAENQLTLTEKEEQVKEHIKYLVSSFDIEDEDVSVTLQQGKVGKTWIINVPPEQRGKAIGKHAQNINAIRTCVRAYAIPRNVCPMLHVNDDDN